MQAHSEILRVFAERKKPRKTQTWIVPGIHNRLEGSGSPRAIPLLTGLVRTNLNLNRPQQ